MRIALFGGTFDPVHNGHLAIARAAADRFALDTVLFIPGGRPPHKSSETQAGYDDRYRMVELGCESDPRFEASPLEDPRTLGARKSYSIDTIERIRRSVAPDDELFFLLGEDAYRDMTTWYRLDDVVDQVQLIVVSRPGETPSPPPHPRARVLRLENLANPVSASEIRARVRSGEAVDQMVPAAVADWIGRRALYRRR